MRDDRALALELDRALAGDDAGREARELAALLVAATAEARFEVAASDVERALARVAAPRRREHARVVLAFAAALALAALAFALLRAPGEDVQARAARALDRPYVIVEEIRPVRPGLFEPTISSGYLDVPRGLGHWTQSRADGRLVSETAIRGGRVLRFDADSNTLTVADSCRALATGCAELLDPVDLYRRSLESDATRVERDGPAWLITIRGRRVDQVARVDARTFLPRSIEWRERGRATSIVRFRIIHAQRSIDPAQYRMEPHPGARVVRVSPHGRVRELGARRIAPPRGAVWLGRSYLGLRAEAARVRFTTGSAIRISYGPLQVWTYGRVVPPEVEAGRVGFVKPIALPRGGVARVYFGPSGGIVAERRVGGRTAAVVSEIAGKIDIVEAARALRRVP